MAIQRGIAQPGADLFEFAVDLEDQVFSMMNALEQVQETLSELTELCPESLPYADSDDAD